MLTYQRRGWCVWTGFIIVALLTGDVTGQPGSVDSDATKPDASSAEQASVDPASFDAVSQRLADAINAGDAQAIRQDFNQTMLQAMPQQQARLFIDNLHATYGRIIQLDKPHYPDPCQAVYPVVFDRGRLNLKIVLDDQAQITGLWFLPYTPPIPVPDVHQTKLRLPFEGNWLVQSGGDTPEQNHHHANPAQRFAFDFIVMDPYGRSHQGQGTRNEDYYAFGRRVLAPAAGMVTDVVDGVRDNDPGSTNPYSVFGNMVVILHKKHEISVLAHLQRGSVQVKVGDRIAAGQPVGLCGNSGQSTQPHLHYQLQNTPIIQHATGIKCQFESVVISRDDQERAKPRYSPAKGDVIRMLFAEGVAGSTTGD